MSIVPQNADKEVAIIDCVHRFFSSHHVGDLLKKCNGTKEKGVSAVSILRYRLGNVFADRSMYMQMRTGSFKEDCSKNAVYRFLPLPTISEWLGHSNIETTRFYVKGTEAMKREVLHKLSDSDSSVFKDDVVFKYANDEDTIKRLCGLK